MGQHNEISGLVLMSTLKFHGQKRTATYLLVLLLQEFCFWVTHIRHFRENHAETEIQVQQSIVNLFTPKLKKYILPTI